LIVNLQSSILILKLISNHQIKLQMSASVDVTKHFQAKRDTDIESAMSACKDLWSLHRSPKKLEKLRSICGKSLAPPVKTRWNSTYDAIRTILDVKKKLTEVYNEFPGLA